MMGVHQHHVRIGVVGGQAGDHAGCRVDRGHVGSTGQRGPGDRSASGAEIEQPRAEAGSHHFHDLAPQLREEGEDGGVDAGNLVEHLDVRGHDCDASCRSMPIASGELGFPGRSAPCRR